MTPIAPPTGLQMCMALAAQVLADFPPITEHCPSVEELNRQRQIKAEAAERYKAAAAKICEERARRKAENFAKRHGGKARSGQVSPLIPAIVGLAIALGFIVWAENRKIVEIRALLAGLADPVEKPGLVVDIKCRRLNDKDTPFSAHVITDPKSMHRWILIQRGQGLVMSELRPSEFP